MWMLGIGKWRLRRGNGLLRLVFPSLRRLRSGLEIISIMYVKGKIGGGRVGGGYLRWVSSCRRRVLWGRRQSILLVESVEYVQGNLILLPFPTSHVKTPSLAFHPPSLNPQPYHKSLAHTKEGESVPFIPFIRKPKVG